VVGKNKTQVSKQDPFLNDARI